MTANVIDLATRQPVPTGTEIRLAKASAHQRLRLTQDRTYLITTKERLTTSEAMAYFKVSAKVVHYNAHTHRAELQAVGYQRGTGGRGHESTFSHRALLHLALIMREGTSERADVIKRALGVWTGKTGDAKLSVPVSDHERACRALLSTAQGIAEGVQDGDPKWVWSELEAMDRRELQGITIALAALLPLDQHGLYKYLTRVGLTHLRGNSSPAHPSRAVAAGLSALIPEQVVTAAHNINHQTPPQQPVGGM